KEIVIGQRLEKTIIFNVHEGRPTFGSNRPLSRNIRWLEIRRERRERTSRKCRIKSGHFIQADLHGKADRVGAKVTDLNGCIAGNFVLDAQSPGEDFWLDNVYVNALSNRAGAGAVRGANEGGESTACQEASAGSIIG